MQRIVLVASELSIITGHNKYETINKAIDSVLNRSKIVKKYIPKSKVEEKLLSLSENDIVRVETEDVAFAGNYRVRGKRIQFDENNMAIGISINRKPPTLAEFISRQDN